ncbi:PAS domain S-box protein [Persicimonas caeni]|uniref:histidine kinase n=1 Tax=Persicimonas caeni TaxID=2292766 RepID=A0A4Y6PZK5_PERCE|nr:ATP-binding protein [Persicimonas caeni]QDG53175.1 PAS domain S-box protein [Persicimonas caeni]QED34397.1 PAS domain S-box protein [Persicimonas caeni]
MSSSKQHHSPPRVSEGDFREVIEHSPDGIAIHRDGQFLYINPSFLELFHLDSAEEVLGTWVYHFVHPDEHAALQERVGRLLDGELIPVRETRLLRQDGSVWLAELTARRVTFDGEPAIASIARDITERQKMTARMMQMDRMIAAGTLAAGVGHEINNPLTFVTANIDFALEQLEGREGLDSVREALQDARSGSTRIRDIVSQLRTFSPSDDDARTSLSARAVIESVLRMVSNEIRHRAKLVLELDDTARFFGNENKLGQVFLNLLINAAHAIEEGSRGDNQIIVRTRTDDSWVIVEVQDSGGGITTEQLPRIFDPFYTTKPVGQGTGLGLYICQQIVEAHDGEIEFESKPGKGTTARIKLPHADTPHNTAKPVSSAPNETRARILLIDDEPLIGRSLSRTLRPDHDVEVETSAAKALARLQAGERFDVILCDLMMPDMTGMDFFEQLAETSPDLADEILFLTGGAFTPRAVQFLNRCSNHVLEKPIDSSMLRALIDERLTSRR